MINFIIIILYFLISILIFTINSPVLFIVLWLFIITINIILKNKFYKIIKFNIKFALFFISLIFVLNLFYIDIKDNLITCFRLITIANITYVLSTYFNTDRLTKGLMILLMPLKLFKIDTESISISINLAINFLPILLKEITEIRYSLTSKGVREYSLKSFYYSVKVIIPKLFKRVNEINYSLISKGYNN